MLLCPCALRRSAGCASNNFAAGSGAEVSTVLAKYLCGVFRKNFRRESYALKIAQIDL